MWLLGVVLVPFLVLGGYRLSIRLVARRLDPEGVTPLLLRGLQWGTILCSGGLIGVSVAQAWAVHDPSFLICTCLGSGWLAGVRERSGHFSSWRAPLARIFSWLTVCSLPVLLVWLIWTTPSAGENVYVGSALRVVIAPHVSFRMDAEEYPEILFIQRKGFWWEKQVGTIRLGGEIGPTRGLITPQWWADVHFVRLEPEQHAAFVFKSGQPEPIKLTYHVPYHARAW